MDDNVYWAIAKQLREARQNVICLTRQLNQEMSDREMAWLESEIQAAQSLAGVLEARLAKEDVGRVGPWISTFSKRRFWLQDPRPEDVYVEDIAHALANICRYGGHVKKFYSVAEHCVLGSRLIEPDVALFFLFHDAAEAYLGDIISPLKNILRDIYEPMEKRVMEVVAVRFGFSMDMDQVEVVKKMDQIMLLTEARDLTTTGILLEDVAELPNETKIYGTWSPELAERLFLKRYQELVENQKKWSYNL